MASESSQGHPFVTANSKCKRPFYVVVEQIMQSNDASCLDLNAGDIFLVTRYNKIGYWWGVSVYDLNRQGWLPSTFTQPYEGEVPEDASKLRESLTAENKPDTTKSEPIAACEPKSINIVTDDVFPFKEYDSKMVVAKRGREVVFQDSERLIEHSDDDIDGVSYKRRPDNLT
jgi:hypothetical protein